MNLTLKLDVVGEEQLNAHFGRVLSMLDDFTEPLEHIGEQLQDSTLKNFAAEGRPGWKPLSELYAAWKEKHYPGQPILVRKGPLKASFQRGGPENIFAVTQTRIEYGTDIEYGIYHQKKVEYTPDGAAVTVESGKGPPQRKIINLQKPEKAQIIANFRKWLTAKGGLE